VKDTEIDEMLDKAAHAPHVVPAGLLRRIADSVEPSLQPVQPLAPSWLLTLGVILIGAAVALLGAARAGFQGVEALGIPARVLIFGTLGLLAGVSAAQVVREWIPGSRRLPSGALLAVSSAALLAVFALLFHDYHTHHFLSSGLTCLLTGLLHAVPAALLAWWLLRRGYAVNSLSAGLIAGTFAGLAGLTMLELHCTNFEALHLLVWHTLVVPLGAALGALAGWAVDFVKAR
jgi:hypothetical protein